MTFAGCGLCRDVDVDVFSDKLYQWAATVTSSGRNMPLALPMRVNRSPQGRGFEVSKTSWRQLACFAHMPLSWAATQTQAF
jgi:hypothetical protein